MYESKPEEIQNAKNIILKIINKWIILDSIELSILAKEILGVSYSIGEGYNESTIRQIAEVKIEEKYGL